MNRLIAVALVAGLGSVGQTSGGEVVKDVAKSPKRPLWTTSKVTGRPEPPPPFRAVRAFPKLNYNRSLYIEREPGTNILLVVELNGKITAMPNDDAVAKTDIVYQIADHEIYSFRFHPEYPKTRQIFIFANGSKASPDKKTVLDRILRYDVAPGPLPKVNMASEKVIIEWPSNGHNGGEMDFGPDGLLYIASGDGTSDSDRNNTGQDISDLASGVIRIDLRNPDPSKAYSIPKDNPFVAVKNARPELWAFGLRNPWRMSFDKKTGDLWIGDIGQDLWEMIRIGKRGANYGWSVVEGGHEFHSKRTRGPGPIVGPVIEHSHSECRSITGGFVYYGSRYPELQGRYLYGDYSTGKVWSALYRDGKVVEHNEIADTRCQILGLCEGPAGEIYLADYSGFIQRLDRSPREPLGNFPKRLSETGIFTDVAKHQVEPGLIAYDVNSPLWSDGAAKLRFIGLPGDGKIEFHEVENWQFPAGTVLVKTFSLDEPTANGPRSRRIETRLMVNDRKEWFGYSYRWNDAQTDAHLVEKPGLDVTYPVVDRDDPQKKAVQTWHFPSRAECMVCHSRASKFVLGLSAIQLNRPCSENAGPTAKGQVNQLSWLESAGAFTIAKLPQPPEKLGKLAHPYDAKAALAERARSYLHTNCSICHIEAGGGNSAMEISYKSAIDKMRLVDVKPIHDGFDLKDARLVAPGNPDRSVLLYRLTHRGRGQMPPLSASLVDRQAVKMFEEWIRSLPTSPPPVKPTSTVGH